MEWFKTHAKALLAFVGTGGSVLLTVWTDTDPLTARDFVYASVTALVIGGFVWGVPNKEPTP